MDPLPAQEALRQDQLLPGSKILTCSDAGHHLYLGNYIYDRACMSVLTLAVDNPEEFNELVGRALDQ
jgi:hypothetical protein